MSLSYDTPNRGDITMTPNYVQKAPQVIPAGTPYAEQQMLMIAYFADDVRPPPARSEVLQRFSDLTGFAATDLDAFFNGTLS